MPLFRDSSDSESNRAKEKLRQLAEWIKHNDDGQRICRILACAQAGDEDSDIQPLVDGLLDTLRRWRTPLGSYKLSAL